MNIIIFGATGNTGHHIVSQALGQGHIVTAFTRNPNKIDIVHDRLNIVQGDVMNLSVVEQALQKQDIVISVLGAGKSLQSKIRSQGTKTIIEAMENTGVKRLISQSTLGAGDSWENLNFYWKYIMFGLILRKPFADHQKQEDFIKNSKLDWTIIRPGAFIEGEKTGNYRHGFPHNDRTSQLKISCADVADFILRQLTDDSYIGKTPSLSY